MRKGAQTIVFDREVYIEEAVSVAGKKEGEGPLKESFDVIMQDDMAGTDNWESAESAIQKKAVEKLFDKAGVKSDEINCILGGDLLGQLIATSFGVKEFNIPFLGLYGACSTFGESMAMAGVLLNNMNDTDRVVALASSHFASAEKQFRFPLEYGNQRPPSATWTVTGCGAVIMTRNKNSKVFARVSAATIGRIVDYGVKDSMNMGACMAPAAADLIVTNFKDLDADEKYYDAIITGDLGSIGSQILTELVKEKGYDICAVHMDCGSLVFDSKEQDTGAGGSGCGCSAITFCGHIVPKIKNKELKRVLLLPTGALLSTVSFNEGETIPGIAHGVVIEAI